MTRKKIILLCLSGAACCLLALAARPISLAIHNAHITVAAREEAKRDIARKHLEIRLIGLTRLPETSGFSETIEKRFGVQFRRVAGCVVTEDVLLQVEAYNDVMDVEINRRFGKGVMDKAIEELINDNRMAANSQPVRSP